MHPVLRADPDHIHTGGLRFLEFGDAVERLAERLNTEVDLTCRWAGDDEFGEILGATCRSVGPQALDEHRALAMRLQQMGADLRAAAAEIRETDEGNADSITGAGDFS